MANFTVSYIYQIIDKFTPVAQRIKASTDQITSTTVTATTAAKQFYSTHMKGLNDVSNKMTHVGRRMTTWVTLPIVGAAALAVREFAKEETAVTQLEAALKGTALAGRMSSAELIKNAKAIQLTTRYSDDAVINASRRIVTMNKITPETALRIQRTAADIAAYKGIDLEMSVGIMGKAFLGNLRGLKDLNINITSSIQKQIKHLKDARKEEELRLYILGLMEQKTRGQAEAAARTGMGPLIIAWHQTIELMKSFGEIFLRIFNDRLFSPLLKFVIYMQGLNPVTKNVILSLVSLLAILGPLTLAIGAVIKSIVIWKTAMVFLNGMGFAMNILTYAGYFLHLSRTIGIATAAMRVFNLVLIMNPIGATITLLATLGYTSYQVAKHWEDICNFIEKAQQLLKKIVHPTEWFKNESVFGNAYSNANSGVGGFAGASNFPNSSYNQKQQEIRNRILVEFKDKDMIKRVTTSSDSPKDTEINVGFNLGTYAMGK